MKILVPHKQNMKIVSLFLAEASSNTVVRNKLASSNNKGRLFLELNELGAFLSREPTLILK